MFLAKKKDSRTPATEHGGQDMERDAPGVELRAPRLATLSRRCPALLRGGIAAGDRRTGDADRHTPAFTFTKRNGIYLRSGGDRPCHRVDPHAAHHTAPGQSAGRPQRQRHPRFCYLALATRYHPGTDTSATRLEYESTIAGHSCTADVDCGVRARSHQYSG